MINAKPRFAVHDNGQVYDYDTQTLHDPEGTLATNEGVYDLAELKEAILKGLPISVALDPVPPKSSEQANADFEAEVKAKIEADAAEHAAAVERKRRRKEWDKAQREADDKPAE